MKLMRVTSAYPDYLKSFRSKRPGDENFSYRQQHEAYYYDSFGVADFWTDALRPLGYESMEITLNHESLQKAWARENDCVYGEQSWAYDIVLSQLKKFKPEVLLFFNHDEFLLRRIKEEIKGIKFILGWVGSAFTLSPIYGVMDLVLSCAPESVTRLRENGIASEHINVAFDQRVLERVPMVPSKYELTFIGQMVRRKDFHTQRESTLVELSKHYQPTVFCSSFQSSSKNGFKETVKGKIFQGIELAKKLGVSEETIFRSPLLQNIYLNHTDPRLVFHPAVYGLEMFETIRESRICLNMHADSSPLFASNMRLFESTGMGSCLVTDWRPNMPELFDPDSEVVTYQSTEECVEKVGWLLDHPAEMKAIAEAGQKRCLKEHLYQHRVIRLDEIIKKGIGAR